jgi:hypothetical protein
MLNNNYLRALPYELGKLFQLQVGAIYEYDIEDTTTLYPTQFCRWLKIKMVLLSNA